MPDYDPSEVLSLVCASGYTITAKLELVCLPLTNAFREQRPWSLLVGKDLPRRLLWWHLRGGDRSSLPYNGGGEVNLGPGFGGAHPPPGSGPRFACAGGWLDSPHDGTAAAVAAAEAADAAATACRFKTFSKHPAHRDDPDFLAPCERCLHSPRWQIECPSKGILVSGQRRGRRGERGAGGGTAGDFGGNKALPGSGSPAIAALDGTGETRPRLSRLVPRRIIQRLVIDGAVSIEGIGWPTGLLRLEMGERVMTLARLLEREEERLPPCCGCGLMMCPQRQHSTTSTPRGKSSREREGGDCFAKPLREVELPRELKQIELLGSFNGSIVGVDWPPGLQLLVLGDAFDQSLDGVAWPPSLASLTLGSAFNQSLSRISWPPHLAHLQLGHSFNFEISDVRWPPDLAEIHFGDRFGQPIKDVAWPRGLRSLTFGHLFRQPVEGVSWPDGLLELTFGGYYNCGVEKASWPAGLRSIDFGRSFNQPVENALWPEGLRRLLFGDCFNHPIEGSRWPPGLRVLQFGSHFDQEIEGVKWPASLERLTFHQRFDRRIERCAFPPGLRVLELGICFDKPIAGVRWPPALELLEFGHYFNHPVEDVRWPDSLRHLKFSGIFNQPLGKVVWPRRLEIIELGQSFSGDLTAVAWPDSLKRLTLRNRSEPIARGSSPLNPPPTAATPVVAASLDKLPPPPPPEDDSPSGLEASVRKKFEEFTVARGGVGGAQQEREGHAAQPLTADEITARDNGILAGHRLVTPPLHSPR